VLANRREDIYNFITNLTGADSTEINEYLDEIVEDKEFHNSLKENQTNYGRRQYSGWGWGIGTTLGIVLYALCRKAKPDIVVETGVASGVSSSYFLCSLKKNKSGVLYSIDFTWHEGESGWIIPKNLRDRWQLIMGKSSNELPPLLDRLRTIDVFFHDSEHTYRNMLFEYQIGWTYLRPKGLLLSHNIDVSDAFHDFRNNVKLEGYELGNMGGLSKT